VRTRSLNRALRKLLPWRGWEAAAQAGGEELVRDARERLSHEMSRRELTAAVTLGVAFVAVAAAMAALLPYHRSPSLLTMFVLVAAYAASSQVEFEIGAGCAVPTELVLVPMLFLLPAGVVPLCVAAGLLAGAVVDHVRRRMHPARMLLVLPNAWHAVGPALVFAAAGVGHPSWQDWPVYAAAFGAQLGFDYLTSAGADWFAHGVSARESVRFLAWVYLVDVLLAPLGVVAAHHGMLSFLPALPLLALFAVFARERRGRIDQTIELSSAYRGTALLLGDVIEADDAYTGSHSRDVVELAVAVADRLRLEPRRRRDVEFAALLHDVGKIHVPDRIINKPGPLDADEMAIIRTHTIEGQHLLEHVGGVLAEVGTIVRSCHEHFDGSGYPDGLAGDAIPIEARIVCASDAYSAMTTDRPYRRARSAAEAVAELRRCAGTHFDPRVVDAIVAIVEVPAVGRSSGSQGVPRPSRTARAA
jgi:HD-GYP domain-containing protein (c-di-GMP phosphodiesterase class II)